MKNQYSSSLPQLPTPVSEPHPRKSSFAHQPTALSPLRFAKEQTPVNEQFTRPEFSLKDILTETYEDMLEDYSESQGQHRKLLRDNGINGSERLLAKRTRKQVLSEKRAASSSKDLLGSRGSSSMLKTIEEPPLMICKDTQSS